MLLENGADPTATDETGQSVLEWVTELGYTDAVELMEAYVQE
ncbi:ankyrin repeat-containing protein [Natrinema pallidum DSM 3751]|uniref:Ankyrin repeat-containing protein n=1 Tax=Natrinema pallidum DSM 3751 TaxID=1227495 RepID=L9YYN8_9EURY|nr:ankyrin repeat-containing protein [Natrinema pallidum DSM 3751]